MADFYGCLECTQFPVKDPKAFLADPDTKEVQKLAFDGFFEVSEEDGKTFAVFGWYGQYPSIVFTAWDEDGEAGERVINMAEWISRHIVPGAMALIGTSGNEKLRCIGGALAFVTSKGAVFFDTGVAPFDTLVPAQVRGMAAKFAADIAEITQEG